MSGIAVAFLLAISTGPQPIAVWSGSDTGLGQLMRLSVEKAIKSSSEFALATSAQGNVPSILIDEGNSSGSRVSFKLTYYAGLPFKSRVLWQRHSTCRTVMLEACISKQVHGLSKFVRS